MTLTSEVNVCVDEIMLKRKPALHFEGFTSHSWRGDA